MYRRTLDAAVALATAATLLLPSVSNAATTKPSVERATTAFLAGDAKTAEAIVAALPADQQGAAVGQIMDQVYDEFDSLKLDTTSVDKVASKAVTARRHYCGAGHAGGHKEKLGIEFRLELKVRVCGDGHGSVEQVKVVSSEVFTNVFGIHIVHVGDSTRILNYNRSGRGVARWTIGATIHGIGYKRSVCPQMQLAGWRPPLLPGRAQVEQKWNDKCSLD